MQVAVLALLAFATASTGAVVAGKPRAPSSSPPPSFLVIMGDDIGWGDFRYANGTAVTPRISAWAKQQGSIQMMDFHSGGTVCSPTRATILTGRNHFRGGVPAPFCPRWLGRPRAITLPILTLPILPLAPLLLLILPLFPSPLSFLSFFPSPLSFPSSPSQTASITCMTYQT
jgi:hypothetical protein